MLKFWAIFLAEPGYFDAVNLKKTPGQHHSVMVPQGKGGDQLCLAHQGQGNGPVGRMNRVWKSNGCRAGPSSVTPSSRETRSRGSPRQRRSTASRFLAAVHPWLCRPEKSHAGGNPARLRHVPRVCRWTGRLFPRAEIRHGVPQVVLKIFLVGSGEVGQVI